MAKLLVAANPERMVANLETLRDGAQRRFVGRAYNHETKKFEVSRAEVVDALPHYINSVKRGDLIAADKATADLCGVHFTESKKT